MTWSGRGSAVVGVPIGRDHGSAALDPDASLATEGGAVIAADAARPRVARPGSRPTVAGAGGVGRTTVAAALGGSDRGVFVCRAVDVLVCRATGDSRTAEQSLDDLLDHPHDASVLY